MSMSPPFGVAAMSKKGLAEILARCFGFALVVGDLVVPNAVCAESILYRHGGLVGAHDVVPGSVAGADEVIGGDVLAVVVDGLPGVDEVLALLGPVLDTVA